MVRVEVKDLSERRMRFSVDGTTPLFLNTLRRTLIAEVPKMAIEEIDFHLGPLGSEEDADIEYESMTPLFDEIIAHRLGMVPVPTDLSLLKFRDECPGCSGKGCPSCTITYIINKKGRKNGEIVYSGDLEPAGGDDAFRVVDKLIPIVKLREDEALLVYATAILGRGKDHVKWQAVIAPTYFPLAKIKLDSSKCDSPELFIEKCPKKVFGKDKKGTVVVAHPENCNLCNACAEISDDACQPGALGVSPVEGAFRFSYETDGSLDSKTVISTSLHIIQEKYDSFISALKNFK